MRWRRVNKILQAAFTHPDDDHITPLEQGSAKLVTTIRPFNDQGFDIAMVPHHGKVVMIDPKVGTGQFHASAASLLQEKYGVGKTAIVCEGDAEQALWRNLGARSVFVQPAAGSLGPIALDPPRLADFLISLIPLKHRENLAGDLEEDYWNRFLPLHGLRMARFCERYANHRGVLLRGWKCVEACHSSHVTDLPLVGQPI